MELCRIHRGLVVVILTMTIFAIAVCGGGSASNKGTSPTVPSTPTISAFQPTNGTVGTSVVVTGTNLMGTTALSFNGMSATFTVNSATQITATVPSGATTGKVAVTTSAGNATSSGNFTVTVPTPTITSFSPSSGQVATIVTINGTNF